MPGAGGGASRRTRKRGENIEIGRENGEGRFKFLGEIWFWGREVLGYFLGCM